MRGVVWYFKVFFYLMEVCISNAHILHSKSPDDASISSLEFGKSVLKAFTFKVNASGEKQDYVRSLSLSLTLG